MVIVVVLLAIKVIIVDLVTNMVMVVGLLAIIVMIVDLQYLQSR